MESLRPLLAVCLPALAALGIFALAERPNAREAVSVLASLGLLGVVASMVPAVLAGETFTLTLAPFVAGVPLALRADGLALLFALLASLLWPVATIYSIGYVRALDESHQTRYFASFAASIAVTMGVAFAGNLLVLFVWYELLTLATYPLVVHKGSAEAKRVGRRYVAFGLLGGTAVLAGCLLVYALAGSLAFTPGGIAALTGADPLLVNTAFALLVGGFGVKAAVIPFYVWLPDAMVAPTPVSSLLHAVAVVKSGVFGLARVVLFVFGPELVRTLGLSGALAALAAATTLLAALLAIRQERFKRGLAYSTVSQLSYIVLGVAVLVPDAVFGALLHIAAHAFMKLSLFFCAGIIYVETHVEYIKPLRGISRRLPLTAALFGVAAAGLVGFPLLAGFVSKWYLLVGLLGDGRLLLAGAVLVASLLKLVFFWPIVTSVVFSEATDAQRDRDPSTVGGPEPGKLWEHRTWRNETTWLLLGPLVAAVGFAVAFGVVPTELPFFGLAERVVTEVLGA
ncbi:proton-conducting transporter transmembrane domain-containing protein [Halarchaeum sp. P4]|uniref:proton-conducting transporter transmembrane domain-containing protein n=1 Tax=Halarchaeum sp. P4 TaxID=3421639 RepID=UPI003EB6CA23